MTKIDETASTRKLLRAAKLTRRRFLLAAAHSAAAGAAVIGAPAIIGRAPVHTAHAAFAGETLIAVSWSGNYEQVFKETVIDPFNAQYDTRAETVGGWEQMVSQIKAAPEDNPPFDITVGEEFVSSSGLAENVFLEQDRSTIPNLEAVYPWFYETRPAEAAKYGIPFGGGTPMLLLRNTLGITDNSWTVLWRDELAHRTTLDSAAWWWTLSVPAVLSDAKPGLEEMWDHPDSTEPLFQELEKLKVAKWFQDGAEQANILHQEEADAAMSYSSDAFTFLESVPGEYTATVPVEGTSAWTDWYFKVRGTRHSDLADVFLNYLLDKETQDRFLSKSLIFMARQDVTVPPQWGDGYPKSNDDFHRMFQLLTMEGWAGIGDHWDDMDARMKDVVVKTTRS
jgi:spermidine/putrescine transport system substrate-binding protein